MIGFFKKHFIQGTEIDVNNIYAAVIVGGSSHILHYFMHKYAFGLNESIGMRILATFLCLTVGLHNKIPKNWQRSFFPFYWHTMLIVALPMSISYTMLINNFNEMWLYWMVFMPIALAIFIPSWFIFLLDLSIGLLGSLVIYNLGHENINFSDHKYLIPFFVVFIFTTITGVIFVYGNRRVWLNKQKEQYTKLMALTGSIVHEIRNPLNVISMCAEGVKLSSSEIAKSSNYQEEIIKRNIDDIIEFNNATKVSMAQANDIINIILADLSQKPIDPQDFEILSIDKALTDAVNKFGYRSEYEKTRVILDLKRHFKIRAVPQRFDFIMYNLIKNSLYYLSEYPDLKVTIGTEIKEFAGKKYNAIYVHDNGPGIHKENISKLFDDFYTFGKKGGTGLGLAFCKRNMNFFDGDIICESATPSNLDSFIDKESWTKFSLLFPVID